MECNEKCQSAFALLQHFAIHAQHYLCDSLKKQKTMTSKQIPDLYPIHKNHKKKKIDSDVESDSGVEDVNPLKFCLVTMDGGQVEEKVRKYQCSYCLKKFGWPTDLKRHILIHTGERPFQCKSCDCSFTRNFLLKKHQRKCHSNETKVDLPELKPISLILKKRKQEKSQIKRHLID